MRLEQDACDGFKDNQQHSFAHQGSVPQSTLLQNHRSVVMETNCKFVVMHVITVEISDWFGFI